MMIYPIIWSTKIRPTTAGHDDVCFASEKKIEKILFQKNTIYVLWKLFHFFQMLAAAADGVGIREFFSMKLEKKQ